MSQPSDLRPCHKGDDGKTGVMSSIKIKSCAQITADVVTKASQKNLVLHLHHHLFRAYSPYNLPCASDRLVELVLMIVHTSLASVASE